MCILKMCFQKEYVNHHPYSLLAHFESCGLPVSFHHSRDTYVFVLVHTSKSSFYYYLQVLGALHSVQVLLKITVNP